MSTSTPPESNMNCVPLTTSKSLMDVPTTSQSNRSSWSSVLATSKSFSSAPIPSTSSPKPSKPLTIVDTIQAQIQANDKVIILMRGLPGSGKSTLAKKIAKGSMGVVLSTDDYFMSNGVY